MHRLLTLLKILAVMALVSITFGTPLSEVARAQTEGVFSSDPSVLPGQTVDLPVATTLLGQNFTQTDAVRFFESGTGQINAPQINSITWQDAPGSNVATPTHPITFTLRNANGPVAGVPPTWDFGTSGDLFVSFICTGTNFTGTTNTVLDRVLVVNTNSPISNTNYFYRARCEVQAPDIAIFGSNGTTSTGIPATPVISMPLPSGAKLFDTDPPLTQPILFIQNTGGANSQLNVQLSMTNTNNSFLTLATGSPLSISGGSTNAVQATCNPAQVTTPGTRSEQLTITHDAGGVNQIETFTIQCTITGTALYTSTPVPGSIIDIGAATVGVPKTVQNALIITNAGNGTLNITGFSVIGNPAKPTSTPLGLPGGTPNDIFSVSSIAQQFSLAPSQSQGVNITCDPDTITFANDPYEATLTVFYTDPATGINGQATYTLNCDGTQPLPVYTSTPIAPGETIVFGDVAVNGSKSIVITVTNTGQATLELQGNLQPPAGFSVTGTTQTIPAGQSGTFTVTCSPTVAGQLGGTLTIKHNADVNFQTEKTYGLLCNGLTGAPIYQSSPPENSTITIVSGSPGQSLVITNAQTAGGLPLNITGVQFPNTSNIFSVAVQGGGGFPFQLAPQESKTLTLTCVTNNDILNGQMVVNYGNGGVANYTVQCVLSGGQGPVYSSSPAVGQTITINTAVNTQGTSTLTITNTGNQNLTLQTPSLSGTNANLFSLGNLSSTTLAPNAQATLQIHCQSSTTGTFSANLSIAHNATGSPATYPLSCVVGSGGGTGVYASTPAPGSTLNITTILNTTGKVTLTISNSGTGPLTINQPTLSGTNASLFSVPAVTAPNNVLQPGQQGTLEIGCQAGTAGTYTAVLSVPHNGSNTSPATYNLSCTVSNVTATPSVTLTPTALPPVTGTAIAECPDGQVLSTPFPQNAAGEFLLVNCFIISQAGTVNISLAQLLASPAAGVTDAEKAQITANAGQMSVWRMGSWFLVESTYNAATQTYSFQSAAGTNIYAFFFGAITRPVGSQSGFAGTTTGNVEDVTVDDGNSPIAALIATVLVIFVVGIFLSRRFRNRSDETAA
jgi:hypothetical protein